MSAKALAATLSRLAWWTPASFVLGVKIKTIPKARTNALPELPTLGPWKTVRPINETVWLLERKPYYYAIDSAGNQLP